MLNRTSVVTALITLATFTHARPGSALVGTRDELLAAPASAQPGDVVRIDGAAEIDLTGLRRIAIPAGVTLAGDRDGSPGAPLSNTELGTARETWPQFTMTGSGPGSPACGCAAPIRRSGTRRTSFEHNRHAIAATGLRTQRYEARFNVVVNNPTGHSFDMHGEHEALGNNQPYAGDVVHIDHNRFGDTTQKAVVIRGRPATTATVTGNCFVRATQALSVEQKRTYPDAPLGNLTIASNAYGIPPASCTLTGRRVQWRLSSGGAASWTPLAPYTFDTGEVGFGDFDGDGRADVFGGRCGE